MAIHHGKEGTVKLSANNIAEVTDWEINEDIPTEDGTAITDAAQKHVTGIPGWTGTLTCNWDETDTNGQRALTIGASVALNVYPEGDQTGDNYYSGTASVTSIRASGGAQSKISATFEFLGNGVLSRPDV